MEASRKELKNAYKRTVQPMGVYAIRNVVNGKVFVGTSRDLSRVWNSKRFQLEMGGHMNRALQAEWTEFGADAFVFEILSELKPKDTPDYNPAEDLATLEALYLGELLPYGERGYHKPPAERDG